MRIVRHTGEIDDRLAAISSIVGSASSSAASGPNDARASSCSSSLNPSCVTRRAALAVTWAEFTMVVTSRAPPPRAPSA